VTTPNPPQSGPQQPYGGPGQPQPQQPYPGQPQQPGQPQPGYFGSGGPQPPGPGGPGPQQPPQYPTAAPKKKSPVRRIVFGLVAAAVIVVIVLVGKQVTGDPSTASVGECMSGSTADNLKVVGCTEAGAEYKVVGKVDGKTQSQANINGGEICKPYPTAETIFWQGEQGGKGYVLCLAPNK
jgi:hypothetical protein